MPTAESEEPEGEPEWAVVSPASSRSSLLPPSGSPRLPTRITAQALLRGQLFVPYTGELYVVWALHDSPFGAQQYCGLHFGHEPWQGILGLTGSGQYITRTHCLRRVRLEGAHRDTTLLSTLVWSGVHLYAAESARHHCRRYVCLWEWR
eukprot:877696-Amphidinium_carterae.3